jgi:hypothetical protein
MIATTAAICRWRSGCSPVSTANASRCARRVGQAGSSVSPERYWSAWSSSAVHNPRGCGRLRREPVRQHRRHAEEAAPSGFAERPRIRILAVGRVPPRVRRTEHLSKDRRVPDRRRRAISLQLTHTAPYALIDWDSVDTPAPLARNGKVIMINGETDLQVFRGPEARGRTRSSTSSRGSRTSRGASTT